MLRPYQEKAITAVEQAIEQGWHNVLVQAPTGAGKSVILAHLLKPYLANGKRILLVAHKIELVNQLYDHIHRWLDFKATIMADSKRYRYNPHCQVVVASIQSWTARYNRNPDFLPSADIVILDEAHHCASNTYSRMFDYYVKAIKVGFTATPRRLDNKGLRFLKKGVIGFQKLITTVEVAELQDLGYLSEFKLYGATKLVDPTGKVRVTAGDYNTKELEQFIKSELAVDDVVNTWFQYANGKKTVLYPTSVALSKLYVEAFNARGIPADHIDGSTSARERERILQRFRDGKITVLGQHSIIIEGVDVPDIEAVQFIRPTQSIVIWFQAIGRALRPAPNKPYAIIIDHSTSHRRLPLPHVPQQWKLDPDDYDGIYPSLCCSHCGFKWLPDKDEKQSLIVSHSFRCKVEITRDSYNVIADETGKWLRQEGTIKGHCPKCNHHEPRHYYNDILVVKGEGEKPQTPKNPELKITEIDGYKCNDTVLGEIRRLFDEAERRGYQRAWVGFKALDIDGIGFAELLWLANELGYKKSWASIRYRDLLNHQLDFTSSLLSG